MEKIRIYGNGLENVMRRLVEECYKLKKSQQRFLWFISSIVDIDDVDYKLYKVERNDLLKLFQLKNYEDSSEITKHIKELMENIIIFNDIKKLIQVSFLSYCEYDLDSEVLKLQFHPYLKPFYIYLKKNTQGEVSDILPLRSIYSIKVYELLKKYQKKGEKEFSIEQIRKIFRIKSDEYGRYNDFKRKVILKAQKELPLKTDIAFDFIEIKEGRKVQKIKFYIKDNDIKT